MPLFCEVALPVPLDRTFTYAIGEGRAVPGVGVRVLVPFGGQRLSGVVVEVHDRAPVEFEAKAVQQVLDEEPLLAGELIQLAGWIAAYYVAPVGEVLRGMLPLSAEVRRHAVYGLAEQGRAVLYEGAAKGSSRRSRRSVEEQNREYAVLNYLEAGDAVKASALRGATGANKALLDGMVRKRWLTREAVAEERDARRMERIAVLTEVSGAAAQGSQGRGAGGGVDGGPRLPRLNENQLAAMAELAAVGGRMPVRELRGRLAEAGVPSTTVLTLVRRGLVRMEAVEQAVDLGGVGAVSAGQAFAHTLNAAQALAASALRGAIEQRSFAPFLLYGVTGSGKTAVYLSAMRDVLAAGRGAILLVPEIGLTPAMVGQVVAAFGKEVALLHSALTGAERTQQWHRIRRGEARVVVGTRSAVFAPVRDLGLILVDEEHDASYKQGETPRYHGRDTAVMRAKLNGAVVVLGSATPSLESWQNAERGRYRRLEMLERVADRPLPAVDLVDMREEFRETGAEQIFARELIEQTQATLDRGEQAIILLNRRGYSFVVLCRACGEKMECENCAVALTYHKHGGGTREDLEVRPGQRMECHYCGFRRSVPKTCPKCASEHLHFLGAGSQQGEERLLEIFPGARIGRMDRDTVRTRGDMERLLGRLHSGEINLLVGTQMIAKGHDIHGITLVGVVGADFALGLPDFRAAERVFQLLTQVSGRAGRGELAGRVLVQTYHPEHYAVRFAQTHDYPGFVAKELQYRRWMHYPPFTSLANVVVQSEQMEQALLWSGQMGRWFEEAGVAGLRVLGPAAAPIVRLKRIFRYHFVLKAERRQTLQAALRRMLAFADGQGIPRKNLVIDVDAVHLM